MTFFYFFFNLHKSYKYYLRCTLLCLGILSFTMPICKASGQLQVQKNRGQSQQNSKKESIEDQNQKEIRNWEIKLTRGQRQYLFVAGAGLVLLGALKLAVWYSSPTTGQVVPKATKPLLLPESVTPAVATQGAKSVSTGSIVQALCFDRGDFGIGSIEGVNYARSVAAPMRSTTTFTATQVTQPWWRQFVAKAWDWENKHKKITGLLLLAGTAALCLSTKMARKKDIVEVLPLSAIASWWALPALQEAGFIVAGERIAMCLGTLPIALLGAALFGYLFTWYTGGDAPSFFAGGNSAWWGYMAFRQLGAIITVLLYWRIVHYVKQKWQERKQVEEEKKRMQKEKEARKLARRAHITKVTQLRESRWYYTSFAELSPATREAIIQFLERVDKKIKTGPQKQRC